MEIIKVISLALLTTMALWILIEVAVVRMGKEIKKVLKEQ